MAGGGMFDYIPLHIIGAENNRPDVDTSPLYDLAVLNIAHYQTTADHRENLFIHGQLTMGITTDMPYEQFKAANPNGVRVGARTGLFLGQSGTFHSVTVPESSSLRTGLQDLEDQMVMLGARIIQRGGQAETAESARINASAEASVLDNVVGNLSEAIEAALEDCARFMGIDPDGVEYKLNRQFWESGLSANDLTSVVGARQAGLIGPTDALHMIRSGRIELMAERDDETILQEVAQTIV
jgi:hypothetical protein